MEQGQEQNSIFGLSIDQIGKTHLWDAARWARFLAVCGFVLLGLMIIYGIAMSVMFANMMSAADNWPPGYERSGMGSAMGLGMGVGMAVFYVICAALAFFPYLFLFRFATKMRNALLSTDQSILNESFKNLKILYRYMGILTIIGLVFMVFGILSLFATAAFMP